MCQYSAVPNPPPLHSGAAVRAGERARGGGRRGRAEWHGGRQAHVPYPEDPASLSDEEWAHYVFFRANPKGLFAERWVHSAGCRRWFNAVRDTATYRFHAVYRPGEQGPSI